MICADQHHAAASGTDPPASGVSRPTTTLSIDVPISVLPNPKRFCTRLASSAPTSAPIPPACDHEAENPRRHAQVANAIDVIQRAVEIAEETAQRQCDRQRPQNRVLGDDAHALDNFVPHQLALFGAA